MKRIHLKKESNLGKAVVELAQLMVSKGIILLSDIPDSIQNLDKQQQDKVVK